MALDGSGKFVAFTTGDYVEVWLASEKSIDCVLGLAGPIHRVVAYRDSRDV